MKKTLLLLTLSLTITLSNAQDFEFGKVSKEELQETSHPIEKDANAAVLYRSQDVKFVYSQEDGFLQENTIYQRVKIYNKEGYDWATQKVRLYNETSSSSETLVGLKGYTYTLENGKIKKAKLKNENIFEEETNKYWRKKIFTMPNIKEGCVIEFEYKIKSSFYKIDDVMIQFGIPVNKIEVEIATPEYYNYKKIINPRAVIYPKLKEIKRNRKELIRSSNRIGNGVMPSKRTVSTSALEFLENVISIDMDNIPALKEEPFVDNLNNYRGKLTLEFAFYQGPSGKIQSFATTWDKITDNIYKNEDFGGQLQINNYFEDDVNALIANATTDSEKIQLIFDHVKSKVKWNDFLGYTSESGVKKAYKNGAGNVADINLMLTAMLRHAGLKANPVLVSTRSNGVPLFPTRSGFNYVICAVEDKGEMLLLDATKQYTNPNILSTNTINWQGRLIREDGSSTWVSLLPNVASKEIVLVNVNINEDLTAKGKVRRVLTNYQAFNYRNRSANKVNENLILDIEKNNPGLVVSKLEVKNAKLAPKPISESYEFDLETATEKIGSNIYFSPLLYFSQEENPFTQDTRLYPIDFVYPIADKHTFGITIPDGYQVESIPENIAIEFNGGAASFSYLIKQTSNIIQLVVSLNINKTLVMPVDYQAFKSFYQLMVEKNSEKIVLKKQ
ncbi:DUF3857 domain-containing protein [Olleya sp. Bg11-27]|uniref:DUF3857 domain-containing protein n=1 Tax=Olleya sp. Bg11-27 TaxID=2058135 RepID=UPI000C3087E0|nr:DUF3857 domain-containing protein [Olleya sp. Bg11-27]AUC75307.1 hypothetical protein CW732_06305 [Olleya sp. Bg11-27]